MGATKEEVLEALKGIYDPEIPVDIVNLGLIYDVAINGEKVSVRMTTTSQGCPVGNFLASEVERVVRRIKGVREASVELVWDPPWSPEMLSEEGKHKLGWT